MIQLARAASTCVVLAALLWPEAPSRACATLSVTTDSTAVVDETAAIVWDQARHTEHFIRRATFDSRGQSVGFLVPTPNVPTLSAVDERAFTRLASWTLPEERVEVHRTLKPFLMLGPVLSALSWRRMSNTFNAAAGQLSTTTDRDEIQVLGKQRVAGYDAVILAASDSRALNRWLHAHGYPSSRSLNAWLRPYIAQGWKITAFKIARPTPSAGQGSAAGSPGSGSVYSSSPVRMSFACEQPFFPYREPSSQRNQNRFSTRSLCVFFLSAQRAQGSMGRARSASTASALISRLWPGHASWAGALSEARLGALATQLKMTRAQLPPHLWMTAFEDFSSPRPGFDDVFFSPSTDQKRLVPPPNITRIESEVPVPIDVLLLALGGLVYALGNWSSLKRVP